VDTESREPKAEEDSVRELATLAPGRAVEAEMADPAVETEMADPAAETELDFPY
jgi:hypothetical protein